MATYDSLSQADKDRIQNEMNLVRAAQIQILRLARTMQPIVSEWNGGVSALIASLDVGQVIPNTSGLAGAAGVTKENLANNLMPYVTTAQGPSTQAHIDNMTPASGAGNLVP